jgi:uncharacterized protein YbjT (DUF2867 family)
MATILLTGANGTVSSATIAALQGAGHKLIGLVRDPSKAKHLGLGIELRTGDLDKPRSLEGAFDGIDTAFLLSPPGPLAAYQQSNALWAARQAKVSHVVRMSAIGAAHDAPTVNSRIHALSDTELSKSGVAFTIVKPHFFTQNLLMTAQSIVEQGTIYFALGDAKLPMVDVADIAASVAAILRDPAPHAGKTYTLTGPTAVSMHQFAAAIGEAIGKPVKYVPVPVAAAVESFEKMGFDDYNQVATRDYLAAYSTGWQSTPTDAVQMLTGRPARGLHEFARQYASAFSGR